MEEWINLISTVGFPIVAFVMLFFRLKEKDNQINCMSKDNNNVLDKLTNAITELTTLIKEKLK